MPKAAIKLIVAADEPALFFASIGAAEGYLEWIDVRDGIYPIAYDPDGNVYRLREDGRNVFVERDTAASLDPEGLNKLLRRVTGVTSNDNEFLLSLCERRVRS